MASRDPKIERDFLDAIDRILCGRPTHPDLQADLANEKLKITYDAVALEAGHSRTLIGLASKSEYPHIRSIIKALKAQGTQPLERLSKLAELRTIIKELEEKLQNQQHENYSLLLRTKKAEAARDSAHLHRDEMLSRNEQLRRERDRWKDLCLELEAKHSLDNVISIHGTKLEAGSS